MSIFTKNPRMKNKYKLSTLGSSTTDYGEILKRKKDELLGHLIVLLYSGVCVFYDYFVVRYL